MFRLILFSTTFFALTRAGGNPADVGATILNYLNEVNPDGSYQYAHATSNGIQADESGLGSVSATESFSYYSPEGEPIQVSYTADKNGFHPVGSNLPTPPPIPDYILKALAYIESHPFKKESNRADLKRVGVNSKDNRCCAHKNIYVFFRRTKK